MIPVGRPGWNTIIGGERSFHARPDPIAEERKPSPHPCVGAAEGSPWLKLRIREGFLFDTTTQFTRLQGRRRKPNDAVSVLQGPFVDKIYPNVATADALWLLFPEPYNRMWPSFAAKKRRSFSEVAPCIKGLRKVTYLRDVLFTPSIL